MTRCAECGAAKVPLYRDRDPHTGRIREHCWTCHQDHQRNMEKGKA